jgi:hypothetical protein
LGSNEVKEMDVIIKVTQKGVWNEKENNGKSDGTSLESNLESKWSDRQRKKMKNRRAIQ